jgi:hypothetical protein
LFSEALRKRSLMTVRTVNPLAEELDPKAALRIWLALPQQAPFDLQAQAQPPVKLYESSDYAERFCLRTLPEEAVPTMLVLCGSELGMTAALGVLLRYIKIHAETAEVEIVNLDFQPLTPVRGHFFVTGSDSFSYFNFRPQQWQELIADHALQGNNTFGWIPAFFPEWSGMSPFARPPRFASPEWETIWKTHWSFQEEIQRAAEGVGLRSLVWISAETAFPMDIPEELTSTWRGYLNLEREEALALSLRTRMDLLEHLGKVDYLWLSAHASILRPFGNPSLSAGDYYRYARRLSQELSGLDQPPELWLDLSGFDEEALDELLDLLIDEKEPFLKVAVCGPGIVPFYIIKTDLPFSMQLITLSHITQTVRLPNVTHNLSTIEAFILGESAPPTLPIYLANTYYELAPITYGAMGVSLGAQDEVQRFIWSMLSWSPSPPLEDILEYYGRWYFGGAAAAFIHQALLSLEKSWNGEHGLEPQKAREALEWLEQAERRVPPKMQALAHPRLLLLKLRARLDLAVHEKIQLDRKVIEQLVKIVRNSEAVVDVHSRLQLAWDAIEKPPAAPRFQELLDELSALQRELFHETNIHIPAIERLGEPSPDRNWFAVQIQQGLHSAHKERKIEQLEKVEQHLRRFWDTAILFIDCGNPQADDYCVNGFGYLLEMPNRQWLSSWWTLSLSENEDDTVDYAIPLDPNRFYRLMVTYNTNQNLKLIQSLYCKDQMIHDVIEVKPNTPETLTFDLEPEMYRDGTLQLSWIPEVGFRAGVAELLLIPTLEYFRQ